MNISIDWLKRQIAFGLVLVMAAPFTQAAVLPQQESSQLASAPTQQHQPNDSSSTSQPSQASPAPVAQQQDGVTKPVGTAAAPLPKSGGVAASRPAGAVIAPGKQRRVRAILIRVGVIVGAAVAVGTVIALSKASPARPN